MENVPVRVVLAESSPLSQKILERMLEGHADIQLVGTTRSGREALRLVEELRPNVLCIGTKLTELSGLELTREVMAKQPVPILVMGERAMPGQAKAPDADVAITLLQAGAVDVWIKPRAIALAADPETNELIGKIKRLSRVPVITRSLKGRSVLDEPSTVTPSATSPSLSSPSLSSIVSSFTTLRAPAAVPFPNLDASLKAGVRIVLIGASTGGPQALLSVLSELPRDFAVPVLCVQHISKGFLDDLVLWLDRQCALTVSIAVEGETALPGHVYFPREDQHLEINSRGKLHLSNFPPRDGHRPSVTATFESGASAYGTGVVAVLMTGMGSDGAQGLRAVRAAGGATIAQNEASCVVFGMPKVAIELGAAQYVLPPPEIVRKLNALVSS
jgi:two-component system chemotaxis response regulator CheB